MVKYYAQLIGDELKITHVGDLDGLKKRVNDELDGDIAQAKKNIQKNIDEMKKLVSDLEAKNKEDIAEIDRINNEIKIANTKKNIYTGELELKRVDTTNKDSLVFFELTPIKI